MSDHSTVNFRALVEEYKVAAFVDSLLGYSAKTLLHLDIDHEALDLEPIRARLKSLRDHDSSRETDFEAECLALELSLREAILELASRESRIDPGSLRQLLYLVNCDREKALTQLLRFYGILARVSYWNDDLTDKVDLTLTLLSRNLSLVEFGSAMAEFDVRRASRQPFGDEAEIDRAITRIRFFRDEAPRLRHLDDVCSDETLRDYRSLKHELGPLLLEPRLAMVLVGTNHVFKEIIDPLLHSAEREMLNDFEAAKLSVSHTLSLPAQDAEELEKLHAEIENFETLKQTRGMQAIQLAIVRQKVRSFAGRTPTNEAATTQDEQLVELEEENRNLREALAELTIEMQELRRTVRKMRDARERAAAMEQYAS